MLKYLNTQVVFREIPQEISLAINITGCPNRCPGCHSPYLWEDTGLLLDETSLNVLIRQNPGITCVIFMGGDNDRGRIISLAMYLRKNHPHLKVAWYSGQWPIEEIDAGHYVADFDLDLFDYIKCGPYIKECGPLDSPSTNQRMYRIDHMDDYLEVNDITSVFWQKKV